MIETFATVVNGFQPLTIVTKLYILDICGSSRPKVFCQKSVFRNFAKFTGKHLCQTFYFNKVTGLRPAILFKKRLWHRYFPVNFPKFLRTPFLTEHLRWLLLCNLLDYAKMLTHCIFLYGHVYLGVF